MRAERTPSERESDFFSSGANHFQTSQISGETKDNPPPYKHQGLNRPHANTTSYEWCNAYHFGVWRLLPVHSLLVNFIRTLRL